MGHRNGGEFRCHNNGCWVSEYHAGVNAAINIADRHDSHRTEPTTADDA
nr:hypothetical protein [Natrarchaeobaculum sulfurireducens]